MPKFEGDSEEEKWRMMMLIMQARQYDVLMALFAQFADPADVEKMVEAHREGKLFGPPPALRYDAEE